MSFINIVTSALFSYLLIIYLYIYIFYYLIYRGLNNTSLRQLLKKLLLNVAAILGIFLTLKIIQGSMIDSLIFSYSIALIITSLLINMPGEKELPQHKPQ